MKLEARQRYKEIPNYSLTGDLLAFHRCGLQYRLQNRGRLPPSTPVQLWFGGFIHGMMEEALLSWRASAEGGRYRQFPWDYATSHGLQLLVDATRLRPKNIIAPTNQFSPEPGREHARSANIRAHEAVNVWGPHLFPLVSRPEIPLHGLRPMPDTGEPARARFFEISGVIDLLASAHIQTFGDNALVRELRRRVPLPDDEEFEIIVDYKGTERPDDTDALLRVYEWQLQTYAWLRSRQEDARPVRAGILLFLTEMYPPKEVLEKLSGRVRLGDRPEGATAEDLEHLLNYRPGDRPPPLSEQLRRTRSLYIIPIDPRYAERGADRFDLPVSIIERAVARESRGEPLTRTWIDAWHELFPRDPPVPRAPELKTCIACDHRTYCPIALAVHGPQAVGQVPVP